MKNYKMINEAITVAEDLLKQEKQHYETYVNNANFQIKYQISDYIYNLLKNAEFPNIQGFKRFNGCELCFNSGNYLCDGQNFQYQLYIRTSNEVSRIFFNAEDYYESTEQPIEENTLIALINNWDYLKKSLPELINEAYQIKLKRITREADEIKRKREIIEGFKL